MRILIAEGDTMFARMIKTMLSRSGYEAECVENGQDAIEYLKYGNYDGAIIDAVLSRINGFDVLVQAREYGVQTPVMVLTAKYSVEETVLCLDSGANDVMAKPLDMREVIARVRAMTRSGFSVVSSVLKLGNLTLDRRNFELSSPDGKFTLTNKEFQVMEMLIMNPSTLIRTDSIFDKVWGAENEVEINVIWVNVSSLRKKLAALNAGVRIKTVRNVGYLMETTK